MSDPTRDSQDTERYQPRLAVISVSTRPGAVGPAVADWFREVAEKDGRFEVDLIDMAEVDLPFLDEPNHPRLRRYEHEHTRLWSERIEAADAVVFVTPEYDFAMSPVLLNAVQYLAQEWHYKPTAFVSYGGVSAGTRSVQMAKLVTTTVKLYSLPEAVQIPNVASFVGDDGRFEPNEVLSDAASLVLTELVKVEAALRPLRVRA